VTDRQTDRQTSAPFHDTATRSGPHNKNFTTLKQWTVTVQTTASDGYLYIHPTFWQISDLLHSVLCIYFTQQGAAQASELHNFAIPAVQLGIQW